MKAREIFSGIHDLHWKNHRKGYGPTLHLSYTLRVDLENGQVRCITIPGFMVKKNEDCKTYTLWPPVHYSSNVNTIYCALISTDDRDVIMSYLEKSGILTKVGTNRPDPASILALEADLCPDMPKNVILG